MFETEHHPRVKFAVRQRIEGLCWIQYAPGVEDILNCVVDTGATKTTIPQAFWEPFLSQDFVRVLPKIRVRGAGGNLLVAELQCSIGVSGVGVFSQQPFDLGRCGIWLAFDRDASQLNSDRTQLKQVLLGLGGGAFNKGGLCVNWKQHQAYLVEID